MKKILYVSDFFKLLNILVALFIIFYSIERELAVASILMAVSFILDFTGNRISNLFEEKTCAKEIGIISDFVTFAVAPVVFAMNVTPTTWPMMIVYILYVYFAIGRIMRHDVFREQTIGMPVSWNGWIVPVFYFILRKYVFFVYLILAFLMAGYSVKKVEEINKIKEEAGKQRDIIQKEAEKQPHVIITAKKVKAAVKTKKKGNFRTEVRKVRRSKKLSKKKTRKEQSTRRQSLLCPGNHEVISKDSFVSQKPKVSVKPAKKKRKK